MSTKTVNWLKIIGILVLAVILVAGAMYFFGDWQPTSPVPTPTSEGPTSPLPTPDPQRIADLREVLEEEVSAESAATEGEHNNRHWAGIDSKTREIRFYADGGVVYNMDANAEGCNVLAYCQNGVPQIEVNPEPLSWVRIEQLDLEPGAVITVSLDLYWDHPQSGVKPAEIELADIANVISAIDTQLRQNNSAMYTSTIPLSLTTHLSGTGYIATFINSFLNVDPGDYQICSRLRHDVYWLLDGLVPMYGWFADNGSLLPRGTDGYTCHSSIIIETPPMVYLPMIIK